ncbi:KBTBD5_10 [Lepeophtheirus salmonis]|uniref:KBTBD5_10 n=1 Tax=Lepeophtheirus salmonis TaxID=72036 RepID=A0A7R8D3V5_LEPSM|nr:KBTBD5_10 [Lepeophtheirus salmonis]CAF3020558.1 KBTBD5_10 [Lepeophtheirus salmonis]
MLKTSLETDLFTDTILHFPDFGIGRTLRCHRIVLMSACPLLKSLILSSSEFINSHDDIHLSLPGGSMRVPQTSILHTCQIIELLHLKVYNNNNNNLEQIRKQSKTHKQQSFILKSRVFYTFGYHRQNAKLSLNQRVAQSVRIYKAENSLDASET